MTDRIDAQAALDMLRLTRNVVGYSRLLGDLVRHALANASDPVAPFLRASAFEPFVRFRDI